MRKLLSQIQTMSEPELREVMRIIERRYAEAYPEWDVVYLAVHKDPALRIQELAQLLITWGREMEGNL